MSKKYEPLFACGSACEIAHPADELRIHDGDLICQDCWEEYRSIDTDIEYSDLPEFVPEADQKIKALADGLLSLKDWMRGSSLNGSGLWSIADSALNKAEAIGK